MKSLLRSSIGMLVLMVILTTMNPPFIWALETNTVSAPDATGALTPTAAPSSNNPAVPSAAPSSSPVISSSTPKNIEDSPIFLEDHTLKGANAREDVFFEIGKGRKVLPGSFVDIEFGHAATLLSKTSTLTLLIDDTPVGNVLLDNSNKEKARLRLDVTNYVTNSGYHKLSFITHMEISGNVCPDPNNPANWLTISKNSSMHLNFGKNYANVDLTWYPSPFLERGSQQPIQTILIVPDDIVQVEFTSAARLVQFFSAQASATRINIPIYTESDLTDTLLRENNTIWIGQTGHWKERGQSINDAYRKQADPALQGQGFIGVGQSLWNPELSGLVVTGKEEEIQNAVSILTDESLYSQLLGTTSSIPASMKKQEPLNEFKLGTPYTVSFEKIGYANLSIGGMQQVSTTFNYNLPAYVDIQNGARLTLAFKHSKSIDLGNSIITVKLNGTPVDSHKLSEATSDSGLLEIDFTQDTIGASRRLEIEVTFQFANHTQKQQQETCVDPNLIGNWAVIDNASSLTYTPVERKSFNLQSIPYSFVMNNRWNQTTFLFPDKIGTKELNVAMTAVGIIGRSAQDNTELTIAKVSAAGLKDLLRDRNILYVGTGKDLPEFMNGFADSSVQFKEEQVSSLVKNVKLLGNLQSRSAVIQLSRSPLNENKSLLLMAATSPDRVSSISEVLTSPTESGKLSGKFVVIDSQNKVHTFEEPAPPKTTAKPKSNQIRDFLTGRDQYELDGSIFIIAFVGMLAVIAGVIWLTLRRK
ncbi:cellulose synthase subunit [Paenibacillus sp. 1_12]|uniref:cellulose biosynthesis cyclic di-GMP-binding regulatory protein BcsB n=1 Tax=Paenibacillus sp. 1_12 TaxID=1566278 RepID=UPI0008E49657|nr:cellulose biosynthesis cyclic di-GMP-binding regulatory protein BcsB [Paenibacillus sp. 1_12]SFK67997.1 cellulose synthase subunit [Paenibacillus sp. 1_12]